MKIKTILTSLTIAATLIGCKNIPTSEEITKIGTLSGYTAAYVLNNQVKLDSEVRNAIIEIMPKVEEYVPQSNETYTVAWTPMVKELVDGYVKDGKMSQAQADRVVKDFSYLTNLLDAYIEKKGIKEYKDLVNTFIHSFCDSFLKNFKSINMTSASNVNVEIDQFTLEFLTNAMK